MPSFHSPHLTSLLRLHSPPPEPPESSEINPSPPPPIPIVESRSQSLGMGCSVREKHIRTSRNPRAVKSDFDPFTFVDKASIPKSIIEAGFKSCNQVHDGSSHNPNPNGNSNFGDHGWGYCTEEQLEEIVMKNLEILYDEAISKLVGLGYDKDVALKAILKNGHCYGGMDVLTNILHNALTYLNDCCGSSNVNSEESEHVFADLRQLEEYSVAGMVCLLQQVRPHLSKGDALWWLLMNDLHVGRASAMEIPPVTLPASGSKTFSNVVSNDAESISNKGVGGIVPPALCRFHGGWGFGSGGGSELAMKGFFSCADQRDVECPKRFNLSPSVKSLLKRNVAMFSAGYQANSKSMQTVSQPCLSNLSSDDNPPAVPASDVPVKKPEDFQSLNNQDGVNLVLSKFCNLNIDEQLENVGEDQKDEMVVVLMNQIKDLEKQVKERKDWAHQKAMQAARKLSGDLTELKVLRMEREEMQRLKKGKQTLEDSTMKRLSEMESALRKASGQVDRANAAVRRLETENAEIRAEMEACKLSASESVSTCLEVTKREKKCLKKLVAWEKQKTKLQEEIAQEKEKLKELQRCLAQVEQDRNETEKKWRQESKAKEQAFVQLEEERRSKEAAKASNRRKLETLRLKIEIDFQRHKDDLQRLEQDLSRLKSSAQSNQSNSLVTGKSEGAKPQGETIAKLLHELDELEDSSEKEPDCDRECIVCLKGEVSIVFLPCAHQVLCASCNDSYGKKGKATCPCFRAPIEQRIRVFGASS